jgi:DNA-directed RNA polymerase specialized sigma24 family protein
MDQAELDRIFDTHPPESEADALAHEQVRDAFKQLARTMSNLPPSRERSLVMTKLEEASFFAHAAIGRHGYE